MIDDLAHLIATAQYLMTLLQDEARYRTDHPEKAQWQSELLTSIVAVANGMRSSRPAGRSADDDVIAAVTRARERLAPEAEDLG